jgi:hypothetical protein
LTASLILENYGGMSGEDIGQVSIKHPYLLDIRPDYMEKNLK